MVDDDNEAILADYDAEHDDDPCWCGHRRDEHDLAGGCLQSGCDCAAFTMDYEAY